MGPLVFGSPVPVGYAFISQRDRTDGADEGRYRGADRARRTRRGKALGRQERQGEGARTGPGGRPGQAGSLHQPRTVLAGFQSPRAGGSRESAPSAAGTAAL